MLIEASLTKTSDLFKSSNADSIACRGKPVSCSKGYSTPLMYVNLGSITPILLPFYLMEYLLYIASSNVSSCFFDG